MDSYYVWMTVLIADYQDSIIADLTKKDYTVSPAAQDGHVITMTGKDPAGVVIALRLAKESGELVDGSQTVFNDVSEVLDKHQMYVYSLIICEAGGASWCSSNFQLPSKKVSQLVTSNKILN